MALNQPRKVQERGGQKHGHPVAALATIYQGGLVGLKSGLAIPARQGVGADNAAKAADAATIRIVGLAAVSVSGGPIDGVERVTTRTGTFLFDNASADPITRADIGNPCFVVDDETVGRTNPNNTRHRAGIIDDFDDLGI